MSKAQDDRTVVRAMTRRAISVSTFILAPLMMGLAFVGEPFVKLILTEKWLPSVPFMRVFCITYMFYPIHTANLNAIKAMGRSDLFLKLEIIKKVVGMIALIITMNISVMAMAYSAIVTSIINQVINSWPNRKLLDYKYSDQLKDIVPNVMTAVFMGVCVMQLERLGLPNILTLLLQIVSGAIIYAGCAHITKNESYYYLLGMIRTRFKRILKR